MQEILNEIKAAKNHKLYRAALALALTLPDICGKVAFPSEVNNGKRYIKWFDDHVYPICKVNVKIDFNGESCYHLRCAVLHSGNLKLEKDKIKDFHLSVYDYSGGTGVDKFEDGKVNLDVIILITNLVNVAEDFYKNSPTPEAFDDFSYSIEDYTRH